MQSDSGAAAGGMPHGGAAGSALCCIAEPLKRDEWSHLTALYAPASSHAPPSPLSPPAVADRLPHIS